MSGLMGYFGGSRKNSRESAKEAIVQLHLQTQMMEKKEQFLQKKIEEELRKAKTNATSNKRRTSTLQCTMPARRWRRRAKADEVTRSGHGGVETKGGT